MSGKTDEQKSKWRALRNGLVRAMGPALVMAALAWGWWAWDQEALLAWKAEATPLRFFAALAVLPALGVPTTPFYVMAGVTFGGVIGVVGSTLSLLVNLLLCYWIGNSGLRPWLLRRLEQGGRVLPSLEPGRATRFTVLVKLAPGVPAFVKNYLIVLAGVPLPLFMAVSMAVTLPYLTAFVVMGELVEEHDWRDLIWVAAVAVGLLGLGWWVRRRWNR